MKEARTLRIMQIVFIVYVVFLFWLIKIIPATSPHTSVSPFDWIIVLLALLSAAGSFIIPNLLLRAAAKPEVAAKSTPVKLWMVRNILRMAFSMSVSLYGLVLHTTGCPDTVVIALISLGLILLLIWRPGEILPGEFPQSDQQINR
jgi:hypothetical protein